MIYIRGMLFCETRSKRHFCHYMAQIAGNFPLKSAHGTKFPWDGTADPWDGNRNPRDGSAEIPRPAAFPTLKGGRAWVSALTVCHIAHKASRRQKHRLRRGGIPAAHTAAWPTDGGKECRGGADAPSCGRQECRPSYTASRHVRIQGGRPISNRGWSEAEPAEHTHPTCIASKRRACHAPPRAWRPHHLPCTNFGKAQVRLRLGKVRKTKLSLTFLSPCTNFAGPRTMVCAD